MALEISAFGHSFLFAALLTCRPFDQQAASFVPKLLITLLKNFYVGGELKQGCIGVSVLETDLCESSRLLHETTA